MVICCSMGFSYKSIALLTVLPFFSWGKCYHNLVSSEHADISACDLFTGQAGQLGRWKTITSLSGTISFSVTGEMIVCTWEVTFFYIKAGVTTWLLKSNVKTIQLKWTWESFLNFWKYAHPNCFIYLFKKLSTPQAAMNTRNKVIYL